MCSANKKVAHLFHWPSFRQYQQSLLQVITLPIGAKGHLSYNERWVNSTFIDEIANINECGGFDTIFWVLSCTQDKENDRVVATFDFAYPIRLVKILKVERKNDYCHINFVAQEFISGVGKVDKNALKDYTKIKFDSAEIPYPGVEKSYVHTGPKIKIETSRTVSLETLYEVLENIRCSSEYREGITISKYPLVKIETIEKSKISESGLYELSTNKEYKIAFSYYQGDLNRDRDIFINGNRFTGKSGSGKIYIGQLREGTDEINIEVKFDDLTFMSQLNVVVKTPWKWRCTQIALLIVVPAIILLSFVRYFPTTNIETGIALAVPLIVFFSSKIWEVLTKKG